MEILEYTALSPGRPRKPFYRHLYFQVILGFALGALLGYLFPTLGSKPGIGEMLQPLPEIFIKLVKMLLAPIIFSTVVIGISQMGTLKEVGRVGLKAMLYFEVVTTIALLLGLAVVNFIQPGKNFIPPASATAVSTTSATQLDSRIAGYDAAAKKQTILGFLMDIVPTSIADAFVTGNMLQVIFVSVLFGLAMAHLPNKGKPLTDILQTFVRVFFEMVHFVMHLAPLAALGAMAFTVGKYGLGTLVSYAKLILCLYLTSGAFVFLVLGFIAHLNRISLWRFLLYIRDEILITFATASTESVMPRMMEKLEKLGCKKSVVGLVFPAGYAFNADGGCIYLTMAAIFLAQATGTPMTFGDQLLLLTVCLFTSKGSAGVAGAAFIALVATLASMKQIPVASLVFLIGIDRFLNEARAVTNLIGNGIATIAVARWENAFDAEQAVKILNTPPDAQ